jgi:hypothetical protein
MPSPLPQHMIFRPPYPGPHSHSRHCSARRVAPVPGAEAAGRGPQPSAPVSGPPPAGDRRAAFRSRSRRRVPAPYCTARAQPPRGATGVVSSPGPRGASPMVHITPGAHPLITQTLACPVRPLFVSVSAPSGRFAWLLGARLREPPPRLQPPDACRFATPCVCAVAARTQRPPLQGLEFPCEPSGTGNRRRGKLTPCLPA